MGEHNRADPVQNLQSQRKPESSSKSMAWLEVCCHNTVDLAFKTRLVVQAKGDTTAAQRSIFNLVELLKIPLQTLYPWPVPMLVGFLQALPFRLSSVRTGILPLVVDRGINRLIRGVAGWEVCLLLEDREVIGHLLYSSSWFSDPLYPIAHTEGLPLY